MVNSPRAISYFPELSNVLQTIPLIRHELDFLGRFAALDRKVPGIFGKSGIDELVEKICRVVKEHPEQIYSDSSLNTERKQFSRYLKELQQEQPDIFNPRFDRLHIKGATSYERQLRLYDLQKVWPDLLKQYDALCEYDLQLASVNGNYSLSSVMKHCAQLFHDATKDFIDRGGEYVPTFKVMIKGIQTEGLQYAMRRLYQDLKKESGRIHLLQTLVLPKLQIGRSLPATISAAKEEFQSMRSCFAEAIGFDYLAQQLDLNDPRSREMRLQAVNLASLGCEGNIMNKSVNPGFETKTKRTQNDFYLYMLRYLFMKACECDDMQSAIKAFNCLCCITPLNEFEKKFYSQELYLTLHFLPSPTTLQTLDLETQWLFYFYVSKLLTLWPNYTIFCKVDRLFKDWKIPDWKTQKGLEEVINHYFSDRLPLNKKNTEPFVHHILALIGKVSDPELQERYYKELQPAIPNLTQTWWKICEVVKSLLSNEAVLQGSLDTSAPAGERFAS